MELTMTILIAASGRLRPSFGLRSVRSIAVTQVETPRETLDMLAAYRYDAAVLLHADRQDALVLDTLRDARPRGIALPNMVLTQVDEPHETVIAAFRASADDVVPLTVPAEVLTAHVRPGPCAGGNAPAPRQRAAA